MKVSLINYTPMPEKMVTSAARVCYSGAKDLDTLLDSITDKQVDSFLNKSSLKNHGSVWEHCSFTFGIEGVSRALSHQLVRHRIASYDQQSQRYVSSSQFEYVTPDKIAKNADAKTLFDNTMQDLQKTYDQLIELGIAKEDARAVLPNACATRLIVTMNARSLFHFFGLRCCVRAQSEIRQMANEMLKLCKEVAPQIFANAGANCEQLGYCPEGDMCCGRAPTIHKLLENYKEHRGDK